MNTSRRNRLACTFPPSVQTRITHEKEPNSSQIPLNTGQNADKQSNHQLSMNTAQCMSETNICQIPGNTDEDTDNLRCQTDISTDDNEPSVYQISKNYETVNRLNKNLTLSAEDDCQHSYNSNNNHFHNRQMLSETYTKDIPEIDMEQDVTSQFGHHMKVGKSARLDSESANSRWATWNASPSNQGGNKSVFEADPQAPKPGERSPTPGLARVQNEMKLNHQLSSTVFESQPFLEPSTVCLNEYRHPQTEQNTRQMSRGECSSSYNEGVSSVSRNKQIPSQRAFTTNKDFNRSQQVMGVASTKHEDHKCPEQTLDVSSTTPSYDDKLTQNVSSTSVGTYSHFETFDIFEDFRSQMSSGKDLCPKSPQDAPGTSISHGLSSVPVSKREEVKQALKETSACFSKGLVQHHKDETQLTNQDFSLSDEMRNLRLADNTREGTSGKVSKVIQETSSTKGGAREKVPMQTGANSSEKVLLHEVKRMETRNLSLQEGGCLDVRPKQPNLSKFELTKDVSSSGALEDCTPFDRRRATEDKAQDVRPKINTSEPLLETLEDVPSNSRSLGLPSKGSSSTKEFNSGPQDNKFMQFDLSEDAPSKKTPMEMICEGPDANGDNATDFRSFSSKVESWSNLPPELLVVNLPKDVPCKRMPPQPPNEPSQVGSKLIVNDVHSVMSSEMPSKCPDAERSSKSIVQDVQSNCMPLRSSTEGSVAEGNHTCNKSIENDLANFSSMPSLKRTTSTDPEVIITANAKALLQQEESTAKYEAGLSSNDKSNLHNLGQHGLGKGVVSCEDCWTGDQQLMVQGDDVSNTGVLRRLGRPGFEVVNSDNVQLVENFHYNKIEMPATGNNNIKSQTKAQLSKTAKMFVETDVYEDVAEILDKENVVFIIGPPSTGKRMTSLALLRKYQEQGFEPFIVMNVTEMRKIVNAETKQAIYLPNLFGPFEFDQQKSDEWAEYFRTLVSCGLETKKYIFSSKSGIFKRGGSHLSLLNICYQNVVFDIISPRPPNYDLPMLKRKLLCCHLSAKGITISGQILDKISDCEANHIFPKLCEIFAANTDLQKEESAIQFFRKPVLYYKGLINLMSQRDNKIPFAVLCLLLLYGKLDQHFNEIETTQHDLAVLDLHMSRSSIQEAAVSMIDSFVKFSEGSFTFIDPCVYDAVALVFGEKFPKNLIQSCSTKFLANSVLVAKEQVKDPDIQMVLEKEEYNLLAERFVQEIRKGNLCFVSQHKAFTHWDFIKPFVQYCQKEDDLRSLIDAKDSFGFSWLYWAAWNAKEHLFKWILDSYRNMKIRMTYSQMGLVTRACCVSGNSEVLRIAFATIKKLSALVLSPKKESIRLPIDVVAGYDEASQNGGVIQVGYLLHTACLSGHVSLVKLLVENYGAETDIEDDSGYRPINIAAKHGHLEIVKYLISRGVKINRRTGKTVLQEACEGGETEMVRYLVKEFPVLVQIPDSNKRQPLHHATLSKDAKMVRCLIASGAKPDNEDYSGNSAFHTACMKNRNLRVLKALNPSPSQVNKKNRNDRTCLHLACQYGGSPMVGFLLHMAADANAVDFIGQTPLHIACKGSKKAIVETLLKVDGIDVFVLDIQGASAFHLTSNANIMELLKAWEKEKNCV